MPEGAHLSQVAQAALRLPDDQRIERISGARWIGYTRAQDILTKLGDLLACRVAGRDCSRPAP